MSSDFLVGNRYGIGSCWPTAGKLNAFSEIHPFLIRADVGTRPEGTDQERLYRQNPDLIEIAGKPFG